MTASAQPATTATPNLPIDLGEKARWDLSPLYASVTDPKLDADLAAAEKAMADFATQFKGQLATKLGDALEAMQHIVRYQYSLYRYPMFLLSTNQADQAARTLNAKVQEKLSAAAATHLTFFNIEVGMLSDADVQAQMTDPRVAHHAPLIREIRRQAKYHLSEAEESILALFGSFGPGTWEEFFELVESELEIDFEGETLNLEQALSQTTTLRDSAKRAALLTAVNTAFTESKFARLSAWTLNNVMGEKGVSDRKRGYVHPISARNLVNMVDDATVDALHDAVRDVGSTLNQRFYRLLNAWLVAKEGKPAGPMQWSDRNAPFPLASQEKISWPDGMALVQEAYTAFSPTLGKLVADMHTGNFIDVPSAKGKSGGAYNASGPYLNGDMSYNLLNYLGSPRDVETTAHELGHGVHGLLALEAQGPLMFSAPMPYAETASVFGEMLTFQHLLATRVKSDEERLAMLMGQLNGFLNTVVRQISFSTFEQRVHAARQNGRLTEEQFTQEWMAVCAEFYGKNGDVFAYDEAMMSNLWCYVGHFHNPFYVYAYAFGELFTHSLYAVKDNFGDKFEPMYLDLLRAGGSKSAVELMAPFGLNPNDPQFWKNGFTTAQAWLSEAEQLSARLGIKV